MSEETKIQWCDSTVNPIMGCGGCELFPKANEVLSSIDEALRSTGVSELAAKTLFKTLITKAYDRIANPQKAHKNAVTTTNIWHLRKEFEASVRQHHGDEAAAAVERAIESSVTCYAAKLHLNKSFSLKPKPDGTPRKPNPGYAPTFEEITRFDGRVSEVTALHDLLGTADPDRPWIASLPRLIFVSDMGDALSRKMDLPWLKHEVIEPIQSAEGKRHLWLWLTKRPERMAELATSIGGLPDNVCAMTTVTGIDTLGRIDQLRRVDAKVRGLSMEPLWEEIPPEHLNLDDIDWVIAGGESGTAEFVREFPVEWAERLQEHCQRNGVAFFLKQLGQRPTRAGEPLKLADSHGGDWMEWDESLRTREFPGYFHRYRESEQPSIAAPRRPLKGGLTTSEKTDFRRLGKVVERAARSFAEAAAALLEIRERKLYRGKFKRFEDYCQSAHQISRQYANKLIKAGRIRLEMETAVSNLGLPIPANEAQLRELGRLSDPDEREQAYIEAVKTSDAKKRQVTARQIQAVVNKRKSRAQPPPPKQPSPTERLRRASETLDELESKLTQGEDPEKLLKKLRKLLLG